MALYRMTHDAIAPLAATTFEERQLRETADLQRLLRNHIAVVASDLLVIAEEFAEWSDSRRRIDLLAIDREGHLVVLELKRGEEGGHMDLQAIRYAAMVSSMTFERAKAVFQSFLDRHQPGEDAESRLLEFLQWDEPREEEFGRDVRIVLVAADFSKEVLTSVLWLNERDLDIRCVRLKPYLLNSELVLDVQQVIPLPEAEEYQVRLREKAIVQRESVRLSGPTGYWFMNTGDGSGEGRAWEDCRKYSFMMAGGGAQWINAIRKLRPGDKLFAYLSGHGYVGFGEVTREAVPQAEFVPPGFQQRLVDLPLTGALQRERLHDPEHCDWCAEVRWIRSLDRNQAVLKSRARRSTLERIRTPELVAELLREFAPDEPIGEA